MQRRAGLDNPAMGIMLKYGSFAGKHRIIPIRVQKESVMNFDTFIASIDDNRPPPRLSETLTALWWDKKGDWDRAHTIAQEIPTVQGSAVHAYLHREEGVLWNADYWYARAGRKRPSIPLAAEWQTLVEEMLAS